MPIPSKTFCDGIHDHQLDVLVAFDEHQNRFYCLEWARRHRKTTLAINILIRECVEHANQKYVYIAPTQVMAKNIVWNDPNMLKAYLPDQAEMGWTMNGQEMTVKFANGSILKVGGADNPDSLRGIDAMGVVFDEWALIKEQTWTEIFRPIIAGPTRDKSLKRWAMFLYTPKGINHATLMFNEACCIGKGGTLPDNGKADMMEENWFVSRLDGEKAGIMDNEELAMAKKDMPQTLYDQEIRCSRITEEERTLITSAMLNDLHSINWDMQRKQYPAVHKIVSVDPAFGGDMCVIRGFRNTQCVAVVRQHPHKTSDIIFEIKSMMLKLKTRNVIVDAIGIGQGVYDALEEDTSNYAVQKFKSSESPIDNQSLYVNKRAEAYAFVAERMRKLSVEPINERELLRQLPASARYKVTASGKAIMIPKDEIKKELSCSPDDADSYVMGIWGLQHVEPEEVLLGQQNMRNKAYSHSDPMDDWSF